MPADTVIELFERSSATLRFDDATVADATSLALDGRRMATALRASGLEPGDRVAVHLPNGVEYVRLLLGCAAAGLVAVSVNTRYSDDEVGELITRSGARQVTLDDGWGDVEPIAVTGRAGDPFVVFTTSGTTSRPKMVLHAQRSIATHAAAAAAGFGYTADDTVMVVMPLCGTFGLTSLMAAVAGDSRVIVTNFDVARTADAIARERVTSLNGSDDMFHRLLLHGADLGPIRLGGYARFNTSLDRVVVDAERAGATLTGLYGMSEVQALFSVRDPSLGTADRARPGGTIVSPDAAFRIVDGELQLRGPSLMLGYLAEGGDLIDPELTAAHFDDGWFRTGDLAIADDPRTFEYLARRGDAMRLGGFLVDPSEIEVVISELPGVMAAQVVAVERPEGARPVAFVIGDFDEREVIAHCRSRLAIYKAPVRVVEVEEFPTTAGANGTKIQRTKLRDLATTLLDVDVDRP
jgi:fatty-acyl-CoA synthase